MRFMFNTNLKPSAQKENVYIFEIINVKNSFPESRSLNQKIENLKNEIENIKNTFSWHVTKPLRKIKKMYLSLFLGKL